MNRKLSSSARQLAINKLDPSALISLICLGVLLGGVAVGLGTVLRDQDGARLTVIAWTGMLVAWSLAGTRLRGWQAALFLALAGIVLILLGAEGMGMRMFAFLQALTAWTAAAFQWRLDLPLPDPAVVFQLGASFFSTAFGIINRTILWLWNIPWSRSTYDPLASALAWSFLMWSVSAWAAWGTRRLDRPLLGVLPAAGIFSIVLSFTRADAYYLTPVLGGTLLLIAWQRYSSRERHWREEDIDFAEDLRFDASIWSLAVAVIITGGAMLLSAFSPAQSLASFQKLIQPRSPQAEDAGQTLGLENRPADSQSGEFSSPGVLPRQHLLGSGPELSREIVMLIRVELPLKRETTVAQPCQGLPCLPINRRFYWRLLSFDLYTGRGWMTSPTRELQYMRGEQTLPVENPAAVKITQQIQMVENLGTQVFAYGEPLLVDQDFTAHWRSFPQEGPDLFSLQLRRPPVQGSYQVTSIHPLVEPDDLRAQHVDYPSWVLDRYLQVPQDTPARLSKLARQLTQDQPTRYDQALAIERYVREIPYSLTVPLPPPGRDVVDYYLNDIRSGYCDYAASAMVVLARLAGLPARIAIGFASGSYDPQNNAYIVTRADAHSWVEIYFPGSGWIEFEPTSGQPALDQPQELAAPATLPAFQPGGSSGDTWMTAWGIAWRSLLGIALALGLLAVFWLLLDSWRLNRIEAVQTLAGIYRRLGRAAARLGLRPRVSETPFEFAARLSELLPDQEETGWRSVFLPAGSEIHEITSIYAKGVYSSQGLDDGQKQQALQRWRRLAMRMRLAWGVNFLSKLRNQVQKRAF